MASVHKPPKKPPAGRKSVFLGGSIENDKAANWQRQVEEALGDLDIQILNPRRENWDAGWTQEANDERLKEQVEWELDGLERVDLILIHFEPGTRSPISLLELGLFARSGKVSQP